MLRGDVPLTCLCLASYFYNSSDGKCQGITIRVRHDSNNAENQANCVTFINVVFFVFYFSESCKHCDSHRWFFLFVFLRFGKYICFGIHGCMSYLGVIHAVEGNPLLETADWGWANTLDWTHSMTTADQVLLNACQRACQYTCLPACLSVSQPPSCLQCAVDINSFFIQMVSTFWCSTNL